jgi:hypothetical protein
MFKSLVYEMSPREPISQMPQEDNAAAEMEHPEKVLSVTFVPDN